MSDESHRDDSVDALLSAGMDDALSVAERAELDGLLVQDAVASRAEAFDEVDAALRSLAEEPADQARIAASLETLHERLDWAEEAPADAQTAQTGWPRSASSFGLGLGLAAAAAAMFFFTVGSGDDARLRGEEVEERVGATASLAEGLAYSRVAARSEAGLGAESQAGPEEEAMVTALGYVEWAGDLSELGLASPEDLEIVEQLELLDFIAAREAGGQG